MAQVMRESDRAAARRRIRGALSWLRSAVTELEREEGTSYVDGGDYKHAASVATNAAQHLCQIAEAAAALRVLNEVAAMEEAEAK